MADFPPQPPRPLEPPTEEQALARAARLLEMCEDETDRSLVEAWTEMATQWVSIAAIRARFDQGAC